MAAQTIEVIPVADEHEHIDGLSCWCNPSVSHSNGVPLIIHNAADRREEIERLTGVGFPDRPWITVET